MKDLHYYTKSKRFEPEFSNDDVEGEACKYLVEWVLKMQHMVMVEHGFADKETVNRNTL